MDKLTSKLCRELETAIAQTNGEIAKELRAAYTHLAYANELICRN